MARKEWGLGVWNVRSLRGEGKKELLGRALAKVRVDVCGLVETREQEAGEMEVRDPVSGKRFLLYLGAAVEGRGGGWSGS